jgi:monovalent cation:H+ antiporter-2, CPA2 family
MGHLPGLIADLALILITGAITTILFRKIRQPLVLGYIIAGFLIGPHLSLTPTVADTENIKTWAEIGVIFLLFSLGLEFSFKKLRRVGGSASITAIIEIIFITIAGYLLGSLLGWSAMDSIFLGGMLASSSTTIISKAFDELGLKTKQFAGVVIGVLIVEDLVVIMLMVLLSTVAVTAQIEGSAVIFNIVKLIFFLILWFIAGIFLIPTFLKMAKKFLDDENLLILSIGLCLGMVVMATQVGFSAELGAFIMGSVLAETTSAEKIEHLIKPVKDLFGAVFFVSVGMLIDPVVMIGYRWPILWVTLLVLFGKFISTTGGALISGQPLKQSVQVGMSMAQVGEFAFIVASLGLSLKVTSDFLFPVAVGVSAITTFTTPYLIKSSAGFYNILIRILPAGWMDNLNNYSSGTQKLQTESNLKKVMKRYINIVVTNSIIVLALFFVAVEYFLPFLQNYISNPFLNSLVVLALSLAVAGPFLWAMMAKRPNDIVYRELWLDKKFSRGPLFILEISRIIIGLLVTGYLLDRLFSPSIAVVVLLPIIIVIIILFSSRTKKFYQRLEIRFLKNLNAREASENINPFAGNFIRDKMNSQTTLTPWDAHLVDLEVNPNAIFIGRNLMELGWRETHGVNIAFIKRGERLIFAPGRDERILAGDRLGIIGTDEQLQDFKPVFESSENFDIEEQIVTDIGIHKIVVDEHNKLRGKSIRDSGIREQTNGLVIGIESNKERILNPPSDTLFEWGDIVWIAGNRKKIQNLSKPSATD